MNANSPLAGLARIVAGTVLSCSLLLSAHGAQTALSNQPFSSSSAVTAKPNILFVLDDSGSMKQDYLPDWAGPYQQLVSSVLTVITPAHRFFNNAFNGVAYNPATRYRPPVMYTSAGALDTTTYPSMTGTTTGTGGDSSATSALPNWRAVKVDGYGIQSTAAVNLEGQAFSYTTVPGEYCNSKQLRSCTASASATGSYTQPAALRWCTTDALANDTTTNAGTNCQASNIANSATNIAAGVTPYIYARMPKPRTSTITVSASGTVTAITVDTKQILNATATGGTSVDLATDIAAKINACTYLIPASSGCTVVGFSATSSSNVVVVAAPTITTSTPAISGGTTSVTAFAGGNVPGGSLFTVITPSVNSYPFPGTATKGVNRIDCAGTTCTYAEEMTNYANWYAYYRTRMQMMKTASSVAFANVDDNFRVGYYTINNGSGSDFINLSAFDGGQKYRWYSRFFNAIPYGVTPLRTGLANAGKIYAGKISTLNNVSVIDPIQYSCQQNYTILSTDGYWNDVANPTKLDGTAIGEQDDKDPRPYYDGATNTRNVTRTTREDLQLGINQFTIKSLTHQLQATTKQLDQGVTTTTTYPKTLQTWQLQTQTTPLRKSETLLTSSTYPLKSDTKQLEKREFKIKRSVYPLERRTYNLDETSYPLDMVVTKITKTISPLQALVQTVQKDVYPLQKKEWFLRTRISPVQQKTIYIDKTTYPLQASDFKIKITTYPLQSSTYKLIRSERQLQQRMETSTDGGDTWQDSGWTNASSCTVRASGPGFTRYTQCRYAPAVDTGGQDTCISVAATTTSTAEGASYSPALVRSCIYETLPIVATITSPSSCNVVAQPNFNAALGRYEPSLACGYSAVSSSVQNGQTACTARDQTGQSIMSNDKVTCEYETTPTVTDTSPCTATVTNSGAATKRTCGYGSATPTQTVSSCTVNDQTGTAAGTAWTNDRVNCAWQADSSASWSTLVAPATCTPRSAFNNTKILCQFGSAGNWSNYDQSSCTVNSNTTVGQKVECEYQSDASVGWNNASDCTPRAAGALTQGVVNSTKITCQYSGTASSTTAPLPTACVPFSQATSGAMSGDKVACSYVGSNWTASSDCTPADPGTAYNATKTSCRYGGAGTATAGFSTCSPHDSGVADLALLSGHQTLDKVVCVLDSSSDTTHPTTCQANDAATPPTSAKVVCSYGSGSVSASNVTSCAPTTGSKLYRAGQAANGVTWDGPAKTCTYRNAVVDTNLPNCSPTGSQNNTDTYSTCGYGTAVDTADLSSCIVDAKETAAPYTGGSWTACVYQTNYAATTITRPSTCSPVAQSGTFAAPEVQCVYLAAVTASNLNTCDVYPESGADPYTGPAVSCYYAASASATNSTLSSCSTHRNTGTPYTGGAAVDCAYNGSPTVTDNVSNCTNRGISASSPYASQIDCTYPTASGWSDVTSGNCAVVPQTGPTFSGPARECRYNRRADTYADNSCSDLAASTGSPYTVLVPRTCVNSPYSTAPALVTTIVDNCLTDPTTNTNATTGVRVDTATTCNYRTAVTSNVLSPTCTNVPESATSPKVKAVTCSALDGPLVPVDPTCTLSGSAWSGDWATSTFDANGKVVECFLTDVSGQGTTQAVISGSTFSASIVTPAKTASCAAGTNFSTKVQTVCTTLSSSGPDPVQNCTGALPTAPDYIKTTCNTTTTPTRVMGCTEQAPISPLWETVTCIYNDDGTKNTLADVAAYYYKTDLRTIALGNCTGAVVSPATTGNVLCTATDDMNNVRASATDPNTAQHMTTFTLGLGASGYMRYSDTYATDTTGDFPTVKGVSPYRAVDGITADPATGLCSWQPNGLCNWPFPPVTGDEQTTIDDLWHAGVNGHGAYYSARDPASLSAGISSALNGVAAAGGYAAAPSLSTPNLVLNDNYLFTSSFVSLDWTGDLMRWRVDPYSGKVVGVRDWSAQAKLDVKAYTSRVIYTFDASVTATKLKAFTSANYGTHSYFNTPYISTASTGLSQFLCTSPDICLTATDQDNTHASGSNLVNFLRGDRTNEGTDIDNTKYYRQRQHVLGDIVNAQSVYVYKPSREYTDPGYAAFRLAQDSRQAVVFSAANDGMVHAFAAKGNTTTEGLVDNYALAYAASQANTANAALLTAANTAGAAAAAAIAADATIGQELWAYIPSMALPKLYKLADKKYRNMHRYLVDATPVSADICTSNCGDAATAVWKTILVGGLGHGGRGYYALDITDPANPKALWEFTHTNLGYSYGNPQITKLSNGTWVVMLSSGYNNIPNDDGAGGDGVGRLFILNAATGAQITGLSPISTGFGDTTTPSGLGNISNIVVNPQSDNTVIAVYGGDLYGNLWRFDVNDLVGPTGTEAQLLAVLKDATGNTQPITTKPIIAEVKSQKVVYVGTGRFLDGIDIADTSQQSLYAIKDPWTTGGTPATAIFDNPGGDRSASGRNTNGFVRQVNSWVSCPAGTLPTICTTGDPVMISTKNAVDFTADNGWFVDLINASEKANTNPALGLGMLVYTTNAPSLLACDIGGKSYLYFINYLTGGPILSAGNAGGVVGYLLSNSFASAPSIVVRATPTGGTSTPVILVAVAPPSTDTGGAVGSGSGGGLGGTVDGSGMKSPGTPLLPIAMPTRRTAWRELISE